MVAFLLISSIITATLANGCRIRKVESGVICVCNSSYCDTVPELQELEHERYQVYSTSKLKPGFNTQTGEFSANKNSSANVIRIKKTQHQRIFGFGGAFTDATGINIRSLPEEAQEKLLESYFGEHGIQYSLCRVPIGGTDFSPRAYTYDDDHPNDVTLDHFQLQSEDFEDKVMF